MKIRMGVEMSGTRNGQPWPAKGEVAELPTAEAAHLVASGIAEEVADGEVEKAVAPPAETSRTEEPEKPDMPPAEKRGRRPRKAAEEPSKE